MSRPVDSPPTVAKRTSGMPDGGVVSAPHRTV